MCVCRLPPIKIHYDILRAKEAAQLSRLVNDFLTANPDWRLHGPTFFANGGYRQAVRCKRRRRPYVLPDQDAPLARS